MPEARSHHVSRRAVLLGGGVLGLSGCGIRLEDDAPSVPLVPTREPIRAEQDLVALLRGTRELSALAEAVAGDVAATLSTIHTDQASVLAHGIELAGVPAADVAAATPTTPTTSIQAAELAAREAATVTTSGSTLLTSVAPALFPTVLTLLAQRGAAAAVLGADVAWSEPEDWRLPEVALPFLEATRAAVYAFEVIAARTEDALREHAEDTLADLRGLAALQEAATAGSTPPRPLGHQLPVDVTGEESATRLATAVLTDLRTAYGSNVGNLTTQRTVGLDVARWLAAAETHAHGWGVDLAPFPGLALG